MDAIELFHLHGDRCEALKWPSVKRQRNPNKSRICERTAEEKISFSYIAYPVNAPARTYQKQLLLDCLHANTLIALPRELNSALVTFVLALNFNRWFPTKKILFIGSTSQLNRQNSENFIESTKIPPDSVCVLQSRKKHDETSDASVIFASAEILLSISSSIDLKSVCLIVIDDAHRATTGSHAICELVRNMIFVKAMCRVVALTDSRVNKMGVLQSIVTNLQIGFIRTLSDFKSDVSMLFSSPRMQKCFIPINEITFDLKESITKLMKRVMDVLKEGEIIYEFNLWKLSNFSLSSLKEDVEQRNIHLLDLFMTLIGLYELHNRLMCEGAVSFLYLTREVMKRNVMMNSLILADERLNKFLLDCNNKMWKCKSHKMRQLIQIVLETNSFYHGRTSIIAILVRNVPPLIETICCALRDHFTEAGIPIMIHLDEDIEAKRTFLKNGVCNVAMVRCSSPKSSFAFNSPIVFDTLICFDESLSCIFYTGKLIVNNEGHMYSLCTADYETNVYSLSSIESATDCIGPEYIRGIHLCVDNPVMLPECFIPCFKEYWAEDNDGIFMDGMLSSIEELSLKLQLGVCDLNQIYSKLAKSKQDLIAAACKESLVWQERLQHFALVGHSTSTITLTRILSNHDRATMHWLCEQSDKKPPIFNDLDVSMDDLCSLDFSIDQETNSSSTGKTTEYENSSNVKKKKFAAPLRIDSEHFGFKLRQFSRKDFADPVEADENYIKRKTEFANILLSLSRLLIV